MIRVRKSDRLLDAQESTELPAAGGAGEPEGPSISTDQSDYLPGSTATITGSGFAPGETVRLQVLHTDEVPNDGNDHGTWLVEADSSGGFVTAWHVCEVDCLGSMLETTAIGIQSGMVAKVRFTDAVQTLVSITPASPTSVGNCYPFGSTSGNGMGSFMGFIYRNVPAFTFLPDDKIRFDLGAFNDSQIRRNIYIAPANMNPASGGSPQNVSAVNWTRIVSETQIPGDPFGNSFKGDYELTYTLEAGFSFSGGGLILAFDGAPPASLV